jgi:SAM-dependent methyltransferase
MSHRARLSIMDPKSHWERVYQSRRATDVSWYQPEARLSLELIRRVTHDMAAPIIDVGGGASTLVDSLLDAGHTDLTVLDLAPSALAAARLRLGSRSRLVHWIEANVLTAELPEHHYGVWHDRAVFHFLTDAESRRQYVRQARRAIRPGGHIIVASFAPEGPERCSGLEVVRYSPESMHAQFGSGFTLLESVAEEHRTPAGAVQSFVYCLCQAQP